MAFGSADEIQGLIEDKAVLNKRINELVQENKELRATIKNLNFVIEYARNQGVKPVEDEVPF